LDSRQGTLLDELGKKTARAGCKKRGNRGRRSALSDWQEALNVTGIFKKNREKEGSQFTDILRSRIRKEVEHDGKRRTSVGKVGIFKRRRGPTGPTTAYEARENPLN